MPLYGRMRRRIEVMMIDNMLFLLLVVVSLSLATATDTNSVSRIVGYSAAAVLVLYEPLLVSFAGGTLGHTLRNLRVVDACTGSNLSVKKAFARFTIKLVLGVVSFISMLVTKRHQAIHDVVTGSAVQVRDPAKARGGDFHRARSDAEMASMPSLSQRIIIALGHIAISFIVFAVAIAVQQGFELTPPCSIKGPWCVNGEHVASLAMSSIWLLAVVVLLVQGLRGKLWGARRRV